MDDGKVNVLSLAMLTELGAALDRAEADRAVVVLTGRDGVFSAGLTCRSVGRVERRQPICCAPDSTWQRGYWHSRPQPWSPVRATPWRWGVPGAVRRLPHRGTACRAARKRPRAGSARQAVIGMSIRFPAADETQVRK